MKKLQKTLIAAGLLLTGLVSLAACGSQNDSITVISREEGSGTRSAFVELLGIEEDGVDKTIVTAETNSSTAVVMQTIAGNKNAIGYISFGSMSDIIQAVSVDNIEPTAENVANGTYPVARPFNIAANGALSDAAQDFMNFILSDDGQKIISDNGYVPIASGVSFRSNAAQGTVTVAGSTSVAPVMEKLSEAYMSVNSGVSVKIQTSDSSTGMNSAIEGLCDLGMASRDLKDSEREAGLTCTVIAMDGIAVVLNNDNTVANLTSEQIRQIFTGGITSWADVT